MRPHCSRFFVIPSAVEESLAIRFRDVSTCARHDKWEEISILSDALRYESFCDVENAATLLAAHNLVSTFGVHRGRRRHFHVTSGTNTVLDRDHGCVAFTRE